MATYTFAATVMVDTNEIPKAWLPSDDDKYRAQEWLLTSVTFPGLHHVEVRPFVNRDGVPQKA